MTETSKEYAVALFELAQEQKSAAEYLSALKLIRSELEASPEYADLLSSPNIPIAERRGLIEQAFASVPEYVLSFTQLLCEKGHMHQFGECADEYEKLYDALSEMSNARVVSAVELTDAEKLALVEKLEKMSRHTVSARYEIDESLLGGVVIYIDGNIIDGSLRHKLKEIKEVTRK